MKDDIPKYNAQCITCLRRRPQARRTLEGNLLADRPGLIVAIDLVGPVEHNQQRYFLFTVIDHFTKFAEVVVLTETSSQTVWQVFYIRWIAVWGCPTYLLSDNGPQFASEEFRSRCKEFGIDKIYSVPYHPQGNGVVESFHQFLVRSVSAYVSQTSWPLVDIVASVLMAYRSTPHPTTNESPYRLMTGLDMTLPHFQEWAEYSVENMDAYRRFNLLAQVRKECLDRVLRNLANNHKIQKGKPTTCSSLDVGDLVLYWLNPNEVSKMLSRFGSLKFAPRWSEPCRIRRFLNKEKTTMVIKSIWHEGIVKKVHQADVMPLPKQLTPEMWNMAKFDLIADLKRHKAAIKPQELVSAEFIRKIPAEDRELAWDHLAQLETAWKEKAGTRVEIEDVISPLKSSVVTDLRAPAAKEGKRRRVQIHALWKYHGNDRSFFEGECEPSGLRDF